MRLEPVRWNVQANVHVVFASLARNCHCARTGPGMAVTTRIEAHEKRRFEQLRCTAFLPSAIYRNPDFMGTVLTALVVSIKRLYANSLTALSDLPVAAKSSPA
jgi:hypothetical protein